MPFIILKDFLNFHSTQLVYG